MNKLILSLTTLCIALLMNLNASADAVPFSSMSLKGLKSVVVEIEGVRDDFSRFGLDKTELKHFLETELHKHGIRIASANEMQTDPEVARIRIKLNANENQYRFYHYGIKLELAQKIPLNQNGGYIAETTWTSGRTGVVLPMDLNRLNGYTADLVELFLKDFHAQNPKIAANVEE